MLTLAIILRASSLNLYSVNIDLMNDGTGCTMRVVIAGGGVAGTACAVALAATGAEVTLYEAQADPAGPVGSFLSLAANGLRGLDVLGALDAVRAAGFAVPRQRMWAGNGKLLGDVARARTAQDPMISVTLMRSDLVSVLREQARRAGAQIVTGRRLTPDDLAAAAADGADLVVGADGIWSATRQFLDPAAPDPVYGGQYSVSGVSHGLGLEPGSWNLIYGRRGAFIYLPAPDGSVWWSAQVSAAQPPGPDADGLDQLDALYAAEHQAVRILRASDTGHGVTHHHVLAPVPRWHDDRTVLVGDAAHPVGSGQGASMAIEDAIVLAQELQARGSVAAALAGYDERRRPRVAKMAKTAASNRDAKVAGPVAARMRNLMMPLFFGRFYEKATAWLYAYDPGTLTGMGSGAGVVT
jgi:2-polyprenyl-6-methoxyphenol hydroxylase-like FAD-dependent oxidoreductase